MYVGDTGGFIGYSATNNTTTTAMTLWMGTLIQLYSKVDSIRVCPSTPVPSPIPTGNPNVTGTCATPWVWYKAGGDTVVQTYPYVGSYAMNGWLYNLGPNDPDYSGQLFGKSYYFHRESAIQQPPETPFFMVCVWVDLFPWETDLPSADLYLGGGQGNPGMSRCAIPRHAWTGPASAPRNFGIRDPLPGAIDMGFIDGHAGPVKLQQLWRCYWHLNWKEKLVNR